MNTELVQFLCLISLGTNYTFLSSLFLLYLVGKKQDDMIVFFACFIMGVGLQIGILKMIILSLWFYGHLHYRGYQNAKYCLDNFGDFDFRLMYTKNTPTYQTIFPYPFPLDKYCYELVEDELEEESIDLHLKVMNLYSIDAMLLASSVIILF